MHKKYELICMDLDGTLLNNEKKVTLRARAALQQAADLGIHIALLSGRMPHAINIIEEQIGLSCIKGSAAGTYITMGDTILRNQTMSTGDMLFVYENFAKKLNIPLWIYKETEWYVTKVDYYVERESRIIDLEPAVADVYELKEMWDQAGSGPNKLLFGAAEEVIETLMELLKDADPGDIDFARSDKLYIEVFPKGANKGSAITAICDALHLDMNKTIAFGDQELDIPMIQMAAFGVAMENSPDHVKCIADAITLSNEEDGVAIAMEKYVLS